ncbi:SSI family serine proteinase inhibitor [Streptomyces sp. NBC_00289]|uniref:SSI family serine proteinase inhibitor n=1 Tax=Streptomyces sp. NBC_00289 TaxID=2975703 RepID=UPI003254CA4E
MRKFTGLAATALAAAGLAVVVPSAHAESFGLYAPSALVLTTSRGEGAHAVVERAVTLSCARAAPYRNPPLACCGMQRATAGDVGTLLSLADDRPCVKTYRPVTIPGAHLRQRLREGRSHQREHRLPPSETRAQPRHPPPT